MDDTRKSFRSRATAVEKAISPDAHGISLLVKCPDKACHVLFTVYIFLAYTIFEHARVYVRGGRNAASSPSSLWCKLGIAALGMGLAGRTALADAREADNDSCNERRKRRVSANCKETITEEKDGEEPLFRFGVIADVQYADIDDGTNFHGSEFRYYRGTLQSLRKAVDYWNNHAPDIQFIAQLGDLIDGQNAGKYGEGLKMECPQTEPAFKSVMREFGRSFCTKVHHAIGNHELYNFGRDSLYMLLFKDKKGMDGGGDNDGVCAERLYYSFKPHKSWRLIMLDSYDISLEGRDEKSPEYIQARQMIDANNPNIRKGTNWFDGIPPERQRFVPFNGAIGARQMEWLRGELEEATRNNEKAIIMTHIPLDPKAASLKTVIWDYPEVTSMLGKYDCVSLVLAGHYHPGGYTVNGNGCHHLTIHGSLTHEHGSYGVVNVYGDRITLHGEG
eukprot:jgi/Bigna1/79100/fgenesh1_pg.59_\